MFAPGGLQRAGAGGAGAGRAQLGRPGRQVLVLEVGTDLRPVGPGWTAWCEARRGEVGRAAERCGVE